MKIYKNTWTKISEGVCTFTLDNTRTNKKVAVLIATSESVPDSTVKGILFSTYTPIPIFSDNPVFVKLTESSAVEDIGIEVQNFI